MIRTLSRYVTQEDGEKHLQLHWRSISYGCQPCRIGYQYIMDLETGRVSKFVLWLANEFRVLIGYRWHCLVINRWTNQKLETIRLMFSTNSISIHHYHHFIQHQRPSLQVRKRRWMSFMLKYQKLSLRKFMPNTRVVQFNFYFCYHVRFMYSMNHIVRFIFRSSSFRFRACTTLASIIWILFYLDFHRKWFQKLLIRELINLPITRTKWKATMPKKTLNIGSVINDNLSLVCWPWVFQYFSYEFFVLDYNFCSGKNHTNANFRLKINSTFQFIDFPSYNFKIDLPYCRLITIKHMQWTRWYLWSLGAFETTTNK